jgi:hypothetical protein
LAVLTVGLLARQLVGLHRFQERFMERIRRYLAGAPVVVVPLAVIAARA